jgi:hypothetical protein
MVGLGTQAGAMGAVVGGAVGLVAIITTPIAMVIAWLLMSVVLFIFAKLLGGKGGYGVQSHLIALYLAPLMVVMTVLGLIPVVGGIIGLLLELYSLYLLTMALKSAHGFDTVKAALVWLIPAILMAVLAFVMVGALLGGIMGGYMSGMLPK